MTLKRNAACVSCCEQVVKYISLFVGMFGGITFVFGLMQRGYLVDASDYVTIDIPESGYGIAVILFGLFGVFVGVIGLIASNRKGFVISTIFIIAATIMGVGLFVLGVLISGFLS